MKLFRIITAFFSLAAAVNAAPVTGLGDIDYWVGSGSNQSALVIQWDDGENPSSVVWGYLWDIADSPTVETMLFDIAAFITLNPTFEVPSPVQPPAGADARLSITADAYSFGNFVTGISYNQNGLDSGEFSQTVRNQSGFGAGGESWTLYTIGTGAAWPGGSVLPADFGMSTLALADGGWYGFAYTVAFVPPFFDPVSFSFDAPVSAVPEPSGVFLLAAGAALVFLRKRHAARV